MRLTEREIKVVAFDADDTLWDCQSWFDEVERKCGDLLRPWATQEEVTQGLFATERSNMALLGYGTKAFTISLVENAVRLTNGALPGDIVLKLIGLGKGLLRFPTTPLPEVKDTLQRLHTDGRYRLAVFTKGELLDQESKLERSGLGGYFEYMETVSNKGQDDYVALCDHLNVRPEELVMVGNSFRSDIAPALAVGCHAIHIPYHVVWELEKSEEFPHERLQKISHFGEVLDILSVDH
ncbi:MAG: HAD family hydrolase [Prevotella sp.]|nr:HAD family hydrolase [Prevotella sp.]